MLLLLEKFKEISIMTSFIVFGIQNDNLVTRELAHRIKEIVTIASNFIRNNYSRENANGLPTKLAEFTTQMLKFIIKCIVFGNVCVLRYKAAI